MVLPVESDQSVCIAEHTRSDGGIGHRDADWNSARLFRQGAYSMRSDSLGDKSFARTISFLTMAIAMVVALVAPIGMSQASAQSDVVIQTRVQILHASPSLGKVEVHINDKEVLDEFSYGDQSDWIDLDPGSVRVTITADRAGFNYAVFDAVYPVPAGNDYTLVISDALILASAIDRSPALDGLARVQVVQASVDLPAVNVVASGSDV